MDYSKLEKAIEHLEAQHKNLSYVNSAEDIPPLMREAVQESVIQRFEVCYDTLWKHLRKYLQLTTGLADIPNSPRPVFRIALENNVLQNIDRWMLYSQARIDTSHDYSEEKKMTTLAVVENFLADAKKLYKLFLREN